MTLDEMVILLLAQEEEFAEEIKVSLPNRIGHRAELIFGDNFNYQGFNTGTGVRPWAPLKRPAGRPILVRTGTGINDVLHSMREPEVNGEYIRIPFEVDDDYMQYHNTGIAGRLDMRKFAGDSKVIEDMILEEIELSLNKITPE